MASMNLKYQGIALTCLILGVGRIRKHYEGGERTDKDELLNGKPLYRIRRPSPQTELHVWG